MHRIEKSLDRNPRAFYERLGGCRAVTVHLDLFRNFAKLGIANDYISVIPKRSRHKPRFFQIVVVLRSLVADQLKPLSSCNTQSR
jgi:hypothetical protein